MDKTIRAGDSEVVIPTSASEAVEVFGDGRDVTVFAGGTILMPQIAYGRYPGGGRTVMLGQAGLEGISGDGTVTIGAMTRLSALAESGLEPLAAAARDIGDPEIRAQATIGGNLCAPSGTESPRGDLQAPLLAMGARVRFADASGEHTEPIDDFLATGERGRLVLAIEVDRPRRSSYLSQRRTHAHSYAVMSLACAEAGDQVRVAAVGLGPRVVRLRSVEQALVEGAPPREAASMALEEVEPHDDALASAWYRRAVLPVLLARVLEQLQGG